MSAEASSRPGSRGVLMVIAWLWVGLPFLYGLVQLVAKIPALFSV
jgi:hypothetical protein